MSHETAGAVEHGERDAPHLGVIYILIVLVEILTISALYVFGRYFS